MNKKALDCALDFLTNPTLSAYLALAKTYGDEKETPMSADIDKEEYGTAETAFDLEQGLSSEYMEAMIENHSGHDMTHWNGCFAVEAHHACALREILRLRGHIRQLEGAGIVLHEDVIDQLNEDKQNLVSELHLVRDTLNTANGQLDAVLDINDKLKRERDEYKFLYMNAFAAVKAIAKLLPEPKG